MRVDLGRTIRISDRRARRTSTRMFVAGGAIFCVSPGNHPRRTEGVQDVVLQQAAGVLPGTGKLSSPRCRVVVKRLGSCLTIGDRRF